MTYDDQLAMLKERMEQRERLQKRIISLDAERRELALRVEELEWVKNKKEADVARMEGKSLASTFYTLIGARKKKLERERAEFSQAAEQYEAAQLSLTKVKDEITSVEATLEELKYCHEEYAKMQQKKRDALKASGSADAQEILKTEQRIAFLLHQKQKVTAARQAGEQALEIAEKISKNIGGAKNLAYADMAGGGTVIDLFKHDQLNRAQNRIEALQKALQSFQSKLDSIPSIPVEEQIRVDDGYLVFVDYVFDNIFTDWDVYTEIKDAQSRMNTTRDRIKETVSRLEAALVSGEKECEELSAHLQMLTERNPL